MSSNYFKIKNISQGNVTLAFRPKIQNSSVSFRSEDERPSTFTTFPTGEEAFTLSTPRGNVFAIGRMFDSAPYTVEERAIIWMDMLNVNKTQFNNISSFPFFVADSYSYAQMGIAFWGMSIFITEMSDSTIFLLSNTNVNKSIGFSGEFFIPSPPLVEENVPEMSMFNMNNPPQPVIKDLEDFATNYGFQLIPALPNISESVSANASMLVKDNRFSFLLGEKKENSPDESVISNLHPSMVAWMINIPDYDKETVTYGLSFTTKEYDSDVGDYVDFLESTKTIEVTLEKPEDGWTIQFIIDSLATWLNQETTDMFSVSSWYEEFQDDGSLPRSMAPSREGYNAFNTNAPFILHISNALVSQIMIVEEYSNMGTQYHNSGLSTPDGAVHIAIRGHYEYRPSEVGMPFSDMSIITTLHTEAEFSSPDVINIAVNMDPVSPYQGAACKDFKVYSSGYTTSDLQGLPTSPMSNM